MLSEVCDTAECVGEENPMQSCTRPAANFCIINRVVISVVFPTIGATRGSGRGSPSPTPWRVTSGNLPRLNHSPCSGPPGKKQQTRPRSIGRPLDRDYGPERRSHSALAWAASCIRGWMTRTPGCALGASLGPPKSSPSAPRPSEPKKGGAGWQEPKCAVLDEPQGAKTAPSARKESGGKLFCFLRVPMQPIWWRRSLVCEMTA